MQRTHVLRRAMPPTAVLLVRFVSATLIGVAWAISGTRSAERTNVPVQPSMPCVDRHHRRVRPGLGSNARARKDRSCLRLDDEPGWSARTGRPR